MMRIDILTLFPEMCEQVLSQSIIGRARASGAIQISARNIRDYTKDKHNRVDDAPYGGTTGMVMQTQPIYDCYQAVCAESLEKPYCIYLSPQGKPLTQEKAKELSNLPHIVMLCGHYEGVDERILETIVDEEVSIGDYVLTGGELPALVLSDAIARMVPGVLPNEEAYTQDSLYNGLLESPQYTRPYDWNGHAVPDILLSGHHANIVRWKREQSLLRTYQKRPDLLEQAALSKEDITYLESIGYRRKSE